MFGTIRMTFIPSLLCVWSRVLGGRSSSTDVADSNTAEEPALAESEGVFALRILKSLPSLLVEQLNVAPVVQGGGSMSGPVRRLGPRKYAIVSLLVMVGVLASALLAPPAGATTPSPGKGQLTQPMPWQVP